VQERTQRLPHLRAQASIVGLVGERARLIQRGALLLPPAEQVESAGLAQQHVHALLPLDEAFGLQRAPGQVEQGFAAVALFQLFHRRIQVRQRLCRPAPVQMVVRKEDGIVALRFATATLEVRLGEQRVVLGAQFRQQVAVQNLLNLVLVEHA